MTFYVKIIRLLSQNNPLISQKSYELTQNNDLVSQNNVSN